MANKKLCELKEKILELSHLSSSISLLHWDLETHMPPRATESRGKAISILSGLMHAKFTSPDFEKLILGLRAEAEKGIFDEDDAAIVREIFREFSRAKKLPKEFVEEMTRVTSEAYHIWVEARKKSDFSVFLPKLQIIIDLKRKEAEYLGYEGSPYNALLDAYEPNANVEELSVIFEELKNFLGPFVKKLISVKEQPDPEILKGHFDRVKQKEFATEVVKKIGYDLDAGRIDESAHPFTMGFHPHDVRFTIRFKDDDLFDSFSSAIHEMGHALYEQGLRSAQFGTPLGESRSLGIHESQSRMWQTIIGQSRAFWTYWYPRLQEFFPQPFASLSLENFYRAVNVVRPSLIRVGADEVTYNLHIVIRFEIEKALIEGSLEPKDLPRVWSEKVKKYLGIDVPNDAMGVLQDVHWAQGMIGYFPTYTLGNLYSAQFYAAAKRDILNLGQEIAKGEYAHLLKWLRDNIHIHGKKYPQDELAMRVSGEKLNPRHFIDYLTEKYGG